MKILYRLNMPNAKRCCENCSNYSSCTLSLNKYKVSEYFDISKCKKFKYNGTFLIYETNDEEFNDQIANLIELYRQKESLLWK